MPSRSWENSSGEGMMRGPSGGQMPATWLTDLPLPPFHIQTDVLKFSLPTRTNIVPQLSRSRWVPTPFTTAAVIVALQAAYVSYPIFKGYTWPLDVSGMPPDMRIEYRVADGGLG